MKFFGLIPLLFVLSSCATTPKTENRIWKNAPLPRIGVRQSLFGWEFFEKDSGRKFHPQGVNWVQLAASKEKWPPNISFNEEYYQSHKRQTETSLREMSDLGYNVVRIRIDANSISGPENKIILNDKYVENLIDFIRSANSHRIYVELTGQWLPNNYYRIAYSKNFPPPNQNSSGLNQLLLSEGLASAFGKYEADLIESIKCQAPELLSGIFALDLWNELYFDGSEKPFSETAGNFHSDLGKSYDLENRISRQALADDAAIRWVNVVAAAVKRIDADILLTSSVFTPLEVQRAGYEGVYTKKSRNNDPRQPFRLRILNDSRLDYLEIHPYPHTVDYDLLSDLKSLEYTEFEKAKPILVGEFGAYKNDFKDIQSAIAVARSFISQVCRQSLAGWLYWTWDTNEQPYLWNMKEKDSAIAKAISPESNPTCD
jgi:hypothetical protein